MEQEIPLRRVAVPAKKNCSADPVRVLSHRSALAFLLAVLVGACSATSLRIPPLHRDFDAHAPHALEASATDHLRLPARVRVRLTSCAGARRLRVLGASLTPLDLERHSEFVRTSDGRLVDRITLEPVDPERGLELNGRIYSGQLQIEPAPASELIVWNLLPLEDYVAGVVASEIALWSALPAEIEAQATVSRTYAVRAMQQRGELLDSTRDQAFRGRPTAPTSAAEQAVADRLQAAVQTTRGQVLTLDGAILDARYHAACGGVRAQHSQVFPLGGRGTDRVTCDPCFERARSEVAAGQPAISRPLMWRWTASRETLAALARELGIGARLARLAPTVIDPGGRWIEVKLTGAHGSRRMTTVELRTRLGARKLKSARILRTWPAPGSPIDGGLFFEGLGRGHGVGLCQEAAHDFAQQGWTRAQILDQAYPGALLSSLSSVEL